MAILSREEFYQQYDAAKQQGMDSNQAINYLAQAAVAAQPYNKQTTPTPQKIDTWQPGNRVPTRSEFNAERGITDTWQPPKTQQPTYNANAALKNLQNIAATTTDKQLAKMITRYTSGDAKKDNFWGQTAASFGSGKIMELGNQAWAAYGKNPTEENRAIARAYKDLLDYYHNVNQEALDDENRKAGWLSRDIAQYAPQFIEQTKASAVPSVVAAGALTALGALTPVIGDEAAAAGLLAKSIAKMAPGVKGVAAPIIAGERIGRLVGTGKYSYDTMYGAALSNVLDTQTANGKPISLDQAKSAAQDEAIFSSVIENLDNAVDIFITIPGFSNGLAEAARNWIGNTAQEYGEEYTQEIISMANQRRAQRGEADSGMLGLFKEIMAVSGEMIKNEGEGSQYRQQAAQAGKAGGVIGAFMMPVQGAVSRVVTNPIQNKFIEAVNGAADAKHARDKIKEYIGGYNELSPEERSTRERAYESVANEINNHAKRGMVLVDADGKYVGEISSDRLSGGILFKIGENGEEAVYMNGSGTTGSLDPKGAVYSALSNGGYFMTQDAYRQRIDEAERIAEQEPTEEERAEAAETLGFEPRSAEDIKAEREAQARANEQAERQAAENADMQERYGSSEGTSTTPVHREAGAIKKELDNAKYQLEQLIKAGVAAYEGDAGAYQRDYQELQARVNDLEAELRVTEQKTPKQPEAPAEKSASVVTEEQKEQPKADKVEQPAPAQNNLTSEEQEFVAFPKQKRLDTTIDGNNVIIRKHGSKGNYSYTVAVGKTVIAQGKTVSEAKQNAEAYFAQQNQASEIPSESPQNAPKEEGSPAPATPQKASTEESRELVTPEEKKTEEQPKAEGKKAEEKPKEKPADDGKKYSKSFAVWREEYLANRTEQVALSEEARAVNDKLLAEKTVSAYDKIISATDTAILEELLQNMAATSKTDGQTNTIAKEIYSELKNRETPKVYEQKEKKAPSEPSKTPEERIAEAKNKAPKLTPEQQKEVQEKLKRQEIERLKKEKEADSITDGFMESMHGTSLDPDDISMSLYDDQQLFNRIAAAGEALGVKHREGEKYFNYINRVLEEAYDIEHSVPMSFGNERTEKSDEYTELDDEEKDPTTFRIDQEYNRNNDVEASDVDYRPIRLAVPGGTSDEDMPKVLAENIRRYRESLKKLDKTFSEFEDDGKAPTDKMLAARDRLNKYIDDALADIEAYEAHNQYTSLISLLTTYANDDESEVLIPYISRDPNPTIREIWDAIMGLDKARNKMAEGAEPPSSAAFEEQLKAVTGAEDVWSLRANELLKADSEAEEWISPEEARERAKYPKADSTPSPDDERQISIIRASADELSARGKMHSTERGAKYVDEESGLSSKDVPELSKANRDAYNALSQEEKILAEEIKDAIGYTEETEDGVTTVDYDWMALSAIMSDPLNNDYINLRSILGNSLDSVPEADLRRAYTEAEKTGEHVSGEDIQRMYSPTSDFHYIQKILSAIIPSRNANEVNEYRVERNEQGDYIIVEAKNGRVDDRTINDILTGKKFIAEQAKKYARNFASDYDKDPKRRSSWLTLDVIGYEEAFNQFVKTHQREAAAAAKAGEKYDFAEEFEKQAATKGFTDKNTGERFFASNGFGMLHHIVSGDFINQAKQFMEMARSEGEAAKRKWHKKLGELYAKRSNLTKGFTADDYLNPKNAEKIEKLNKQIAECDKRIKDADKYLYQLDNYGIKVKDAQKVVFKDENGKRIKFFQDVDRYSKDRFFSVKGLSNGVSESLVKEIFDQIAEEAYAKQTIRDIAPKEGTKYTGGTLSAAEIAKRRDAADKKRLGKAEAEEAQEAAAGRSGGEVSEGTPSGIQPGDRGTVSRENLAEGRRPSQQTKEFWEARTAEWQRQIDELTAERENASDRRKDEIDLWLRSLTKWRDSSQQQVDNFGKSEQSAGSGNDNVNEHQRHDENNSQPEQLGGEDVSGRSPRRLTRYKTLSEARQASFEIFQDSLQTGGEMTEAIKAARVLADAKGTLLAPQIKAVIENNGGRCDTFTGGGVCLVKNGRTLDQAAKEDGRFKKLIKSASGKKNVTFVICDSFSYASRDSKYDVSKNGLGDAGRCVNEMVGGKLKHTIYATDYDTALHEYAHSVVSDAMHTLFGAKADKNNYFGSIQKLENEYLSARLRQAFEEAGLGDQYDTLMKTVFPSSYKDVQKVEELFVELDARYAGGTFSLWGEGKTRLDKVVKTLKEKSPAFNNLVEDITKAANGEKIDTTLTNEASESKTTKKHYNDTEESLLADIPKAGTAQLEEFTSKDGIKELREDGYSDEQIDRLISAARKEIIKRKHAGTYDTSSSSFTIGDEGIEAGMGASNNGEVLERDDYAAVMQTLDEMSRSKEYRAYQGQANTDKQRRQTFYDDMNAPSDVMEDLARSLEAARPHSEFKTAKDLYDMEDDHKPYERIKKVAKNLNTRPSVFSDRELYEKKFGSYGRATRIAREYQDYVKLIGRVAEGKATFNSLYQKLILMKDADGIGVYITDDILNYVRATSVAEARVYASGNPKSNDAINFRNEAADTLEMLSHRIDQVNDVQTNFHEEVNTNAAKYGTGKEKKLPGQILQLMNKLQISPYNAARMIDAFNKAANGAGYRIADMMERSVANRIMTEAKLKEPFAAVKNTKGYRELANGTAKGSVEINGRKATLMEEAYMAGLYRTLAATDKGRPDWSRLDSIKGLYWSDGTTTRDGKLNGQKIELPGPKYRDADGNKMADPYEARHAMLEEMYGKIQDDIARNEAAFQYADAVTRMFSEAKTLNQNAFIKRFGYAREMFQDGQYMPTAYWSDNGEMDGQYEMMGDLRRGLVPGFMSRRVREAGGYLVVRPLSQVVDSYIGQTANFTAFSELGDTLDILMNDKSVYGSMADTVGKAFGKPYGDWWRNYTDDVNMVKEADPTGINKYLANSRNAMMQGALIGSLSVPIKQVSSTFSMMGKVDPIAVIKAIRPIIRSNPERVGATNNLLFKGRLANTEAAQLLKTGLLDRIRNSSALAQNVIDATTYMDTRAVANVYLACCYDVERNSGLTKADIYKNGKNARDGLTNAGELLVNAKFSDAVMPTQPIFIKQARAEIARSKSELVRMLSTFRTQQTQNYNRLLQTFNEARAAKKFGGDTKAANTEFRQTVEGQIMAAASISALTIFADMLLHKHKKYKDDDDKFDEAKFADRFALNLIEAGAGTTLFGGELSKWLIDQMRGNTGDYASNKEFYGISMGSISSLKSAFNAWSWLIADYQKGGKHFASNARYVINYTSTLLGIPAQNVYNVMNSLYQYVADAAGKDFISGYDNGKYEDMLKEWDGIRTDYGNKFFNAIKAGDKNRAQESVEQMGDKMTSIIKASGMEQLRSGELDDEAVINSLMNYADMFRDEAEDAVAQMHYEIDTGFKWGNMRKDFESGKITEADAIGYKQKYGGMSKDKATTAVRKWTKEAELGYSYDKWDDAYKSDKIKRERLIDAYTYIGMSKEDATDKVDLMDFKAQPGCADATAAQMKAYNASIKGTGISASDYMGYVAKKNELKQEGMIPYINSLPLSKEQKDALYASFWKTTTSTFKNRPWR